MMSRKKEAPIEVKATHAGSEQTNSTTFPQSCAIQQAIILRHLQAGNRLTTLQSREKLGICYPAARIQSLREAGWNIVTHWATETDITGRKHRIAEYVLISCSEVA